MAMIKYAEDKLLTPASLSLAKVQDVLEQNLNGIDWADVYIQERMSESWVLEDGKVKTGSFSMDSGIGLRAVRGETTACVSSDIISTQTLSSLSDVARAAKTHGKELVLGHIGRPKTIHGRFADSNVIFNTSDEDKIALLEKIDALVRNADSQVENVIANIGAAHEVVLIIRSDGIVAADIRPMVRLNISVIITDGNKRETGSHGGGGRCDLSIFDDAIIANMANKALAEAHDKLTAKETPAGVMPVVLGPGWAGIILHEAVGHGLEGDFNRKKMSAFAGRIGERVAAPGVTVVDAGNIANRRGSLSCDDEGTPTGETVLIEDGILRGYLQDIVNARLMKSTPSGNGRRESYASPPMPRMTNTFMRAGNKSPEEIIASVKDGIYAADFNGGEVDITNGNFVFVASKARLIKNGKLGDTVKGATIIGNGPAIMPKISMLGNDFSLDPGVGTCGKDGQWVPVGVGQPTIKVDAITVGGTAI